METDQGLDKPSSPDAGQVEKPSSGAINRITNWIKKHPLVAALILSAGGQVGILAWANQHQEQEPLKEEPGIHRPATIQEEPPAAPKIGTPLNPENDKADQTTDDTPNPETPPNPNDDKADQTTDDTPNPEELPNLNPADLKKAVELMKKMDKKKMAEILQKIDPETLKKALSQMDKEEIAQMIKVMGKVDPDKVAEILNQMEPDLVNEALKKASTEEFADIIAKMDTDKLNELLEKIPPEKIQEVLKNISAEDLPTELKGHDGKLDPGKVSGFLKNAEPGEIRELMKKAKKTKPKEVSPEITSNMKTGAVDRVRAEDVVFVTSLDSKANISWPKEEGQKVFIPIESDWDTPLDLTPIEGLNPELIAQMIATAGNESPFRRSIRINGKDISTELAKALNGRVRSLEIKGELSPEAARNLDAIKEVELGENTELGPEAFQAIASPNRNGGRTIFKGIIINGGSITAEALQTFTANNQRHHDNYRPDNRKTLLIWIENGENLSPDVASQLGGYNIYIYKHSKISPEFAAALHPDTRVSIEHATDQPLEILAKIKVKNLNFKSGEITAEIARVIDTEVLTIDRHQVTLSPEAKQILEARKIRVEYP